MVNFNVATRHTLFVLACFFFLAFAPANFEKRSIYISGIVMDSNNLLPLNSASIYDESGNVLGKSDSKGFFNVAIENTDNGEIFFNLKVKKAGYRSFEQKEHWGDISGNQSVAFYFGLQNDETRSSTSFSHTAFSVPNNYTAVNKEFERVLSDMNFDRKVENAKLKNNNVFFTIDQKHYMISDTGWIEIASANELISIDGESTVMASK